MENQRCVQPFEVRIQEAIAVAWKRWVGESSPLICGREGYEKRYQDGRCKDGRCNKNNDIFCTRKMVKMTVYANKQVMGGVIARQL